MSQGQHGYSAGQWVDFLEGTLDHATALVMRNHLAGCAECREIHADLQAVRSRLAALSARVPGADSAAARVRSAVLARIRMEQSARQGQSTGVDELRRILIPICGPAATESALRHAARRSATEWLPFVEQLRSIVEALCGASVAEWISETAHGIRWRTEPGC